MRMDDYVDSVVGRFTDSIMLEIGATVSIDSDITSEIRKEIYRLLRVMVVQL